MLAVFFDSRVQKFTVRLVRLDSHCFLVPWSLSFTNTMTLPQAQSLPHFPVGLEMFFELLNAFQSELLLRVGVVEVYCCRWTSLTGFNGHFAAPSKSKTRSETL